MAIALTNGTHYIKVSPSGGITKTDNILEAKTFYSCNVAMRKVFKAPGKCKGYYPFDTEDMSCVSKTKRKRKNYSKEERKIIYDKAKGRCELCGQKLLFQDMTLDHIIPLSMGGADEMDNLQSACYVCNQFKSNILPEDFIDKVVKIFLYQMRKRLRRVIGA